MQQLNVKEVKFKFGDLAGQEGFRKIIRKSYGGASGAILVYDVTNKDSMLNLENWMIEVKSIREETIPIIFVGNKIDLRETDQDHIRTETASDFIQLLSRKFNADYRFIETSALTGENISSAFEDLIDLID